MKKILAIFSISYGLLLLAGFASCRKEESLPTPSERLQGKWKKVRYATDDNNNGKIEDLEIHNSPEAEAYFINFNADATGIVNTNFNNVETELGFVWYIKDGDSVHLDYNANYSISYYLSSISSYDLKLISNGPLGLAAYYYKRQ